MKKKETKKGGKQGRKTETMKMGQGSRRPWPSHQRKTVKKWKFLSTIFHGEE